MVGSSLELPTTIIKPSTTDQKQEQEQQYLQVQQKLNKNGNNTVKQQQQELKLQQPTWQYSGGRIKFRITGGPRGSAQQ